MNIVAEIHQSLLPPLNNIILSYLEGLPEWCYLSNNIVFNYHHSSSRNPSIVHTFIQEIIIEKDRNNIERILLRCYKSRFYNLKFIRNCSSTL
jgi:hypothetical protein